MSNLLDNAIKNTTDNDDIRGTLQNPLVYGGAYRSTATLGGIGASAMVRLTNVASGAVAAGSEDAVNGSQLFSLTNRLDLDHLEKGGGLHQDDTPAVVPNKQVTDRFDGGGQRVTNVVAGEQNTDAVNVGQLNDSIKSAVKDNLQQAQSCTDQQIGKVHSEMDHDRKDAVGGTASAIAKLPQLFEREHGIRCCQFARIILRRYGRGLSILEFCLAGSGA